MLELARPTTCGTRCSAGRIQRAAKPPIQKGHKRVVLHRGFAQVRRFGSALSWRRRVAFQRRGDRPHYCFLQRLRCTVTRTNVVARAAVTSRMHASIRSRLRYPCNPHSAPTYARIRRASSRASGGPAEIIEDLGIGNRRISARR